MSLVTDSVPAAAASPADAPAVAPVDQTPPAAADPAAPAAPAADPADPAADPAPDAAKPDETPQGAPEAYADFTAPEGVTLDEDAIGTFKDVAKELNLPQDQAQKVVNIAVAMQQKQQAAVLAQAEAWATESRDDPEFGGEHLDANLAHARRAIEAFGSPKLAEMLNTTALGNHPEVVRMLVKVGKLAAEDGSPVRGGTRPAVPTGATPFQRTASVMYPSKE